MNINSLPIREQVHFVLRRERDGDWIYCYICAKRLGRMPKEAQWDALIRREFGNEFFKRHLTFSPGCVRFKFKD